MSRETEGAGILRVTFDTNAVPANEEQEQRLRSALKRRPAEIKVVSVTPRELENSSIQVKFEDLPETAVWDETPWGGGVWGGKPVQEVFALGESRLETGVLGGSGAGEAFEEILQIISNKSFPASGKRSQLSDGQRRQLRDAMIFEAHVRDRRDIFVSNDVKAFGRAGEQRRADLEKRFETRIMTLNEFLSWI